MMRITDELREWMRVVLTDDDSAHAIADRIDVEHQRQLDVLYKDMSDAEWVRLPKDADGVPIRVGDKVVDWDTPRLVVAVSEDSICLAGYESDSYYRMGIAKNYHHYTPDTWERIIEDAVNVHGNGFNPCWTDERDALVARCKALAGDE